MCTFLLLSLSPLFCVTNLIIILQSVTALLICPWTYLNFTSSKYIQLTTTVMRNIGTSYYVTLIVVDIEPLPLSPSHLFPPLISYPCYPISSLFSSLSLFYFLLSIWTDDRNIHRKTCHGSKCRTPPPTG